MIGNSYASVRQYPQALESYRQALEVAKMIGSRKAKGTALSGSGAVHRYLGQYAQALSYYQQALGDCPISGRSNG